MQYGNEFKVGLALVVTVLVFFFGVRYFEDIPLFSGTYELVTELDDAGGVISGNQVRVSGFNVGSVTDVRINPETNRVRVTFQVDATVKVPEGSTTQVAGFEAFGFVYILLNLGPPDNPALAEGSFVPSAEGSDLLGDLSAKAPALVDGLDSTLVSVNATLAVARTVLADPESNVQQTLTSVRGTLGTVDALLREEQARISRVLDNAEVLTANLNTLAVENRDSVAVAVENLNALLRRVDQNLAGLDETMTTLDAILAKIDNGEGTLGMMINDPALYHKLDSTLTNVNALVTDFQERPVRYLRHLRFVDLF